MMDDSHASITSLCIGSPSCTQDPFIFLAKEKKIERKSLKDLPKLSAGIPPGMRVVMMVNAFMTDKAWLEIAYHLVDVIHTLPIVCDLSLDGFGSHFKFHLAQRVFLIENP